MWLIIAFGALGLLIGNLVGLTSESVVTPVVGLLFTFVGTSILAVLHKLNSDDRQLAGKCILALSISCLLGIYLGLAVNEHKWLTPKELRATRQQDAASKYLRSDTIRRANLIDSQKQRGSLTPDQAYEQMYQLALHPDSEPPASTQ